MASQDLKIESRVTGICLCSYPALFTPRARVAKPGEAPRDPQWEITLVALPEHGAKEWLRAFKADALALLRTKYAATETLTQDQVIEQKIAAGQIHWPFKPVTDEPGYPAGGIILRAANKKARPGTVSRFAKPGTNLPADINDPEKFYPGCLVRASIRPYLYGYNVNLGSKGVTFNLNNVQLCDDMPATPRLDNRKSAQEEFDAVEAPTADMPAGEAAALPSAANSLLD